MAVAHKSSLSMELVLIPIGLYKTTTDNDIHFNQLGKESKARIRYKKYCSHCNIAIRKHCKKVWIYPGPAICRVPHDGYL